MRRSGVRRWTCSPSASRLCDHLVNGGFIERRTSVGDRRIMFLSLTFQGSKFVASMMEHRRDFAAILATNVAVGKNRAASLPGHLRGRRRGARLVACTDGPRKFCCAHALVAT